MNYLFIRTYPKDDYLARLCYESWMLAGYEGEVIMYAEEPIDKKTGKRSEYNWIKGIGKYIERPETNNFGGQMGAWALIEGLRKFEYKSDDIIISCDADIIIKENPLKLFRGDFAGKGGMNEHGFNHVSGQMMIMRGWLANKIIQESKSEFNERWQRMDEQKINIADDTYFSYFTSHLTWGYRVQNFCTWIHDKPYHLEPRTDWKQIIADAR